MPASRIRPAPRRVGAVLRLCVCVVVPATDLLFRRRWHHLDRIPASGPAILAVNHVSYLDPFLVARAVWDSGRVPHFLAKASLFELPVGGAILRHAGQIPVLRASRGATQSLDAAVQALRRGEVVVIYPEGTVTRDEQFWPMAAKTGLARLMQRCPDVPVIPVGQWGAQQALDVYRRRVHLLKRVRVAVSAGPAVDPTAVAALATSADSAASMRLLTDLVMTAVRDQVATLRDEAAPVDFFPRPVGLPGDRERP